MIYRPQFAYPTPPGCRDMDFVYFFDGSNTPFLNQNISGLTIPLIPLVMEQDAPFFWRATKINADRELNAGVPDLYDLPKWSVKFLDCYDNPLSDDLVPATEYGYPSNPWTINRANLTGPPTPHAEIYCPPGGVIHFFVSSPSFNSDSHFVSVSLHGVKRFKECL